MLHKNPAITLSVINMFSKDDVVLTYARKLALNGSVDRWLAFNASVFRRSDECMHTGNNNISPSHSTVVRSATLYRTSTSHGLSQSPWTERSDPVSGTNPFH